MTTDARNLPSPFYRVSIKALIFNADQRLLVFKDKNGEWEVPGGGWEHDETFKECLARELAEEAKATVTNIDGIAFCYKGWTAHGSPKVCVAARVRIGATELVPTDDDLVEICFVTKEELLELPFQQGEKTIKQYVDQIWQSA